MASTGGYIKLHRKMTGWEWYSTPGTFCLFVHLLLMADYAGSSAGQVSISRAELCRDTGLTEKQVRTALAHLIESGEIRKDSEGKQRMTLTVANWQKYQPAMIDGPRIGPSLGPSEGPSSDTKENQPNQCIHGIYDTEGAKGRAKNGAKNVAKFCDEGPSDDTPRTLELQGFADAENAGGAKPKKYKKDKNIEPNGSIKSDGKITFADDVRMTQAEYDKLVAEHGQEFADECIRTLSLYKGSSGRRYKSDYKAILSWVIDRVTEKRGKAAAQQQKKPVQQQPVIQREYVEDNGLPQWMLDMMAEEDRQKGAG